MVKDDRRQAVDTLIGRRLDDIRTRTGIPIVFGGATHVLGDGTQQVVIDRLGLSTYRCN